MSKSLIYTSNFSTKPFPQAYCLDPVINFDANTKTGNIRVVIYADKDSFDAGKAPLDTKDYPINPDNYDQYRTKNNFDFDALTLAAWGFVKMVDSNFNAALDVVAVDVVAK